MRDWWRRLFSRGDTRSPQTDPAITQFAAAWRAKHGRAAWRPVTTQGDGETRSWFGGQPLVEADFAWPACGDCGKPMRFFLQLDLGTLPEGAVPAANEGLLQLFYCPTDDGDCETWAPFSGASHLRLLAAAGELMPGDGPDPLPKAHVDRWEHFEDTPSPSDFHDLGLDIRYDFAAGTADVTCVDPPIALEGTDLEVAEQISEAAPRDKLGGWPYWVQGPELPQCPECGETMALVFQLDSEDNVPHMFGDVGCGHVTQCPRHPEVLAFGWACS